MLLVSLLAVVLLAETLSESLEHGIRMRPAGRPLSSASSSRRWRCSRKASPPSRPPAPIKSRRSLNLAIGSAIASIGLTIPAVAGVSPDLGRELTLGLDGEGTALLLLTLFVSSLTLATGRATILQGAVHLVIFGVFLLLRRFRDLPPRGENSPMLLCRTRTELRKRRIDRASPRTLVTVDPRFSRRAPAVRDRLERAQPDGLVLASGVRAGRAASGRRFAIASMSSATERKSRPRISRRDRDAATSSRSFCRSSALQP